MTKKTADEKFLLKIYELASASGDLKNEVDAIFVGHEIGENDKKIQNIVKLLSRSSFIKKIDDNNVILTQKGIDLVEELKS